MSSRGQQNKKRKYGGNKNVTFIQQYCIRIGNRSGGCGSKWFTDILLNNSIEVRRKNGRRSKEKTFR